MKKAIQTIIEWFIPKKKEEIDFSTDCFQDRHEWDTHKEEGKIYCWICGAEKKIKK